MLLREDNKEALQPARQFPLMDLWILNEQGGLTEDNLTVFKAGMSSGLSMVWIQSRQSLQNPSISCI